MRPIAKYCSACGAVLAQRIPEGDTRVRGCCEACGTIHYVNPRPVVGTIPVWGEHVLLCRRAIEPCYGAWTLPAGFMEVGETSAEGASRETAEEARARVEMGPLLAMIDVPGVEQIHLFYRARLLDQEFAPGVETLEVRLFLENEIPWDQIGFRTVATALRLFFEDRARGSFGMHTPALPPRPRPG